MRDEVKMGDERTLFSFITEVRVIRYDIALRKTVEDTFVLGQRVSARSGEIGLEDGHIVEFYPESGRIKVRVRKEKDNAKPLDLWFESGDLRRIVE